MEGNLEVDKEQGLSRIAALGFLLGIVPQAIIEAAITAALPESARDLGLNGEFAAQMLMGMGALGLMLGALLSGKVLEAFGSRYTYLGSLVVLGIAGSGGLYLESGPLFASRVISGFAASCIATTCLWGISTQLGRDSRAKRFGFAGALGGLSAIGSVIVGGLLTEHFGWRFAFLQFVVVALVLLPIAFAGVKQQRPAGIPAGQPGYFKRMVPLYLEVLLLFLIIGMFSMQLPFLLDQDGITDASARGLIQAIPGVGVIGGGIIFGALQQRIGPTWTLVISVSSFAFGLLLVATNHTVLPLAVGAAATGLCMGMCMPYFYHAVSERSGPGTAGRYLGYLTAATFLGVFTNPMIFEPLKAEIGVRNIFLLSGILISLLAVEVVIRAARLPTKVEV